MTTENIKRNYKYKKIKITKTLTHAKMKTENNWLVLWIRFCVYINAFSWCFYPNFSQLNLTTQIIPVRNSPKSHIHSVWIVCNFDFTLESLNNNRLQRSATRVCSPRSAHEGLVKSYLLVAAQGFAGFTNAKERLEFNCRTDAVFRRSQSSARSCHTCLPSFMLWCFKTTRLNLVFTC